MALQKVTFTKLVQDSQELGSNDKHMASRVFFKLEINGETFDDYANLKQVVGSDINADNIEVGPPHEYEGPFNHSEFHKAATEYFLGLIGTAGGGIQIGEGARSVRMRNNTFNVVSRTYEWEV
jgi:hypothetical protein